MDEKILPARFYRTDSGKEPVREWLKEFAKDDRMVIGADIKTVEFGWPIGMPTCRSLGQGLWEVRSNLPSGVIARTIFCIYQQQIILLHSFIKKSQKTPKKEIEIALKRKSKLEELFDD